MGYRHSYLRGISSLLVTSVLVLAQPLSWSSQAFAQQNQRLHIRVLEGGNRILHKNESLELVVEVRDGQTPVPGAEVTFIAPESGPGILFTGNAERLTVKADARGRATSGRTRSIGAGAFSVAIVAMAHGNTTTTSTQAANQTPDTTTPTPKKKSKKLMWILIAAGGGAAAVAFAAKGKSGSGTDENDDLPPTITVGPPTIGAPE